MAIACFDDLEVDEEELKRFENSLFWDEFISAAASDFIKIHQNSSKGDAAVVFCYISTMTKILKKLKQD